jgi:hypothetical protein
MTDFNITADMTVRGLLPSLCTADIHDVLADCLNELNRRDGELELSTRGVTSQWADVSERDGRFRAVYHDLCYAEDASKPVGGA